MKTEFDVIEVHTSDEGRITIHIGFLKREFTPTESHAWPPLRRSHTEPGVRFLLQRSPIVILHEYWPAPESATNELAEIVKWIRQRVGEMHSRELLSLDDILEEFEEFVGSFQNPELRPSIIHEGSVRIPMPHFPTNPTKLSESFVTRRTDSLAVSVSEENFIIISSGDDSNAPRILIHPDQVEVLCAWLCEAHRHIVSRRSDQSSIQ
ncbi:MAG: hypothetical protein AB1813_01600 [Verrucomicrobiota bacterium]